MKKGISIWSFIESSLERCFELAKAAGFDGVELALAETGEVSLESTEEEIKKIKSSANEKGIELYSVASGLYWSYSLTDNDPAIRDKAERIVKKQLDIASWIGCDTILVVPGMVSDKVSYDLAYNRSLAALNRLSPYAAKQGVTIGIENVWNKFLLSPLEMRDFIDKADSPYVKAYFDVGNVIRDGFPEQWIRILGSRIIKIHFKDYKRSSGTLDGFVDLLSGSVNYPEVMAALTDIGYDDWVTAELTPYADYPETLLKTASCSMNAILDI